MNRILLLLLILLNREYICAQPELQQNPQQTNKSPTSSAAFGPAYLRPGSNSSVKGQKNNFGNILSRFFLKANIGYGFISPGSYKSTWSEFGVIRNSDNSISGVGYTKESKSLGRGVRVGGGLGFILNDFMQVGIDIEYQAEDQNSHYYYSGVGDYDYYITYDRDRYKGTNITPYVMFKAVTKPRYFIYTRLGVLFTMPGKLHSDGYLTYARGDFYPPGPQDSSVSTFNVYSNGYERRITLKKDIGINFGFGINLRVTDHIRLFGEMMGNFTTLKPKSAVEDGPSSSSGDYFYPSFDYSTDPPTFIRYDPAHQSFVSYYHKDIKYKDNLSSLNTIFVTTIIGPPPEYRQTAMLEETQQTFDFNMNVVSVNLGIIYRF